MKRRGWTLHEMLIALILTTGVMALAAHHALQQFRWFHGAGAVIAMRGQVGHASGILARALWGVSPGLDVAVALDSAVEFHAAIGSAVVCAPATAGTDGRITIPAPSSTAGNVLASFWETPDASDRVHAFFDDSLGTHWMTFHLASPPLPGGACPASPGTPAWLLILREPVTIPLGTTLRITRPVRFSHYRASDGKWYLGARDWNAASERLNTIQPVAGPLLPHSANPERSGLLLVYRDASGVELPQPVELARIASVTLTARAEAAWVRVAGLATKRETYADSSFVSVTFRNR